MNQLPAIERFEECMRVGPERSGWISAFDSRPLQPNQLRNHLLGILACHVPTQERARNILGRAQNWWFGERADQLVLSGLHLRHLLRLADVNRPQDLDDATRYWVRRDIIEACLRKTDEARIAEEALAS